MIPRIRRKKNSPQNVQNALRTTITPKDDVDYQKKYETLVQKLTAILKEEGVTSNGD